MESALEDLYKVLADFKANGNFKGTTTNFQWGPDSTDITIIKEFQTNYLQKALLKYAFSVCCCQKDVK